MSYQSEIEADSPHWWFRLGETQSDAVATGAHDAVRPSSYLTPNATPRQVTSIVPSEPGAYASQFGYDDGTGGGFGGGGEDIGGGGIGGTSYVTRYSSNSTGGNSAWAIPNTTTQISAEAWIKVDALSYSSYQEILYFQDFCQVLLYGNSIRATITNIASGGQLLSTSSIAAGSVYHVVVTYSTSTKTGKIYVNGTLVGSETWTPGSLSIYPTAPSTSSPNLLTIGSSADGSSAFVGTVCEVAFYKTELSASRILAHYNAGIDTGNASITASESGAGVDAGSVKVYAASGESGVGSDGVGQESTGSRTIRTGESGVGSDVGQQSTSLTWSETDLPAILAARVIGVNSGDGEFGLGTDSASTRSALSATESFPPAVGSLNNGGQTHQIARETGMIGDGASISKVLDTTPPPTPTGLAAVPVALSPGGRFDLSWASIPPEIASDVASYGVYANGLLIATVSHTIGVPTRSYSTASYPSATRVRFAVDAVDGAGNRSPLSSPVYATIPVAIAPGFVFGYTVGVKSVTVNWAVSALLTSDPTLAPIPGSARVIELRFNGRALASPTVRGDVVDGAVFGSKRVAGLLAGASYRVEAVVKDNLGAQSVYVVGTAVVPLAPLEGTVTGTQLATILDGQAVQYLVIKGDATYGAGEGEAVPIGSDRALSRRSREQEQAILATQSYIVSQTLLQLAHDTVNNSNTQAMVRSLLGRQVQSVNSLAQALAITGVGDLAGLLRYFNGGGAGALNQCLAAPEYNDLRFLVTSAYLNPLDVYAPNSLTLATFSASTSSANPPAIPSGVIDLTRYAGARRGVLRLTGGGSGTVTVTGIGKTGTGATTTGRTWSVAVTATGTATDFYLAATGGWTDESIASVTSISISGSLNITGTLKPASPTGRSVIAP